ncbi:hypothetical protein [Propionivibrio dicarboxylicus]|uniref:Uncharacterized protein n=1 Tax=Propionivibrio dicarboxylicus TaxID=83767 RepID=A0A1G8FTL0_9RHOO|nr:hypothetical protein [Propionivibrio dicarboxylicus]SDH85483.1 hypothetical protein SAMN05660652_02423 [Propionivibrio dicarboxylicus]
MNPGLPVPIGTCTIALILWFFPLSSAAQTGTTLGRLFFTPEARQALDRQRRTSEQSAPDDTAPGELRIDGIVIGTNARTTVWINGRPLVEDPKTRGLSIRVDKADPSRITLLFKMFPPLRTQIGAHLSPETIRAIPPLEAWAQNTVPDKPQQ